MYTPVGFTGYGVVGLNLIKYLHNLSVDVTVFPVSLKKFGEIPQQENKENEKLLHELVYKDFDPKSTCVKIWHQFDLAERIGTGKYIGFPFFEIDTFNEREKIHLRVPDELVVSSQWAKDIILQNGIDKKISVVPLGVDLSVFSPSLSDNIQKSENNPYIFMSIGKWEVRKGHDILYEIFNKAFSSRDNVELWVAASSSTTCFSEKELLEWHSYYESGPLRDKIKIIPRLPSQQDLANMIAKADCGIFLSRAEGWNLELLEMMSMNKPVITTNYSAHTEFCNSSNSFLIDIDKLEPAYDGKWFWGHGNWANFGDKQKDQAIEFMKQAYNSKIRTNQSGVETGLKYSWKNSAQELLKCI